MLHREATSKREVIKHAHCSHCQPKLDMLPWLQVARAVDSMLGDSEQDVDQLVVVLDAQQATTLQVTRKVNLIKQIASLLNQVCLQS